MDYPWNDRGGGDLTRVQFSTVAWDRTLEGKTLFDLVKRTVSQPTMETAGPMVVDAVLRGGAGMVYHNMDEGDVRRFMAHPMTMIASDGRLTRRGDGVPHPRSYGTFPRVLGEYVRVQKVLTLEQAVNRMTLMPAARLGLQKEFGCLNVGCFANVVVFDAATVMDAGTLEKLHAYAEGIPFAVVNGAVAVESGGFAAARAGRVVRNGRR